MKRHTRDAAALAASAAFLVLSAHAEVVRKERQSREMRWDHVSETYVLHELGTECVVQTSDGYTFVDGNRFNRRGDPPMLLVPIEDRYVFAWQWANYDSTSMYNMRAPHRQHEVRMYLGHSGNRRIWDRIFLVRGKDRPLHVRYLSPGEADSAHEVGYALEEERTRLYPRWWAIGLDPDHDWLTREEGKFRVVFTAGWQRRDPFDGRGGRQERVVEWHQMDVDAYAEAKERLALCRERHLSGGPAAAAEEWFLD